MQQPACAKDMCAGLCANAHNGACANADAEALRARLLAPGLPLVAADPAAAQDYTRTLNNYLRSGDLAAAFSAPNLLPVAAAPAATHLHALFIDLALGADNTVNAAKFIAKAALKDGANALSPLAPAGTLQPATYLALAKLHAYAHGDASSSALRSLQRDALVMHVAEALAQAQDGNQDAQGGSQVANVDVGRLVDQCAERAAGKEAASPQQRLAYLFTAVVLLSLAAPPQHFPESQMPGNDVSAVPGLPLNPVDFDALLSSLFKPLLSPDLNALAYLINAQAEDIAEEWKSDDIIPSMSVFSFFKALGELSRGAPLGDEFTSEFLPSDYQPVALSEFVSQTMVDHVVEKFLGHVTESSAHREAATKVLRFVIQQAMQ
jgi:hypothetical protein